MQIVLLDETRFDTFASNHPNRNFYQSVNYGKMMNKHGHNAYYLGLVNDSNEIKAATLLIVKNDKNDRRKMGYAPRGFLIDWNDFELVKEFSENLKTFLLKRSFTYIKVDPPVIYKQYDYNGNEKIESENNLNFVSRMQSLGYIHLGYNDNLETIKPRWNAITSLNENIISLYNSIKKEARNKITLASNQGIKVYKGSINDINILYGMIENKNISLDYFYDYYEFYNQNNNFEIYFAKLEPVTFVNSSKSLYEKEERKNQELNEMIQSFSTLNKENLINEKMESDNLIAKYKKDMQDAINFFQKYPNGIIIGGAAILKYGDTVTFISSEINKEFTQYFPNYLLKWHLFQEFAKQGYKTIDFKGIIKDYISKSNYLENAELSNKIVEYVGEFDLVINKKSYYTGNRLTPILNWLNTPI